MKSSPTLHLATIILSIFWLLISLFVVYDVFVEANGHDTLPAFIQAAQKGHFYANVHQWIFPALFLTALFEIFLSSLFVHPKGSLKRSVYASTVSTYETSTALNRLFAYSVFFSLFFVNAYPYAFLYILFVLLVCIDNAFIFGLRAIRRSDSFYYAGHFYFSLAILHVLALLGYLNFVYYPWALWQRAIFVILLPFAMNSK
jgi:hypothetical protein